jgi:hypothetical protein
MVTGCLGVPVQFYPGSSPSTRISDGHGPTYRFPSPEPSQGHGLNIACHLCRLASQDSTWYPLHTVHTCWCCLAMPTCCLALPGTPFLPPGTAFLQPTQHGSICLLPMLYQLCNENDCPTGTTGCFFVMLWLSHCYSGSVTEDTVTVLMVGLSFSPIFYWYTCIVAAWFCIYKKHDHPCSTNLQPLCYSSFTSHYAKQLWFLG